MDWLNKIRKWPAGKKRFFAFSVAIFLTILVIVFNSALNLIWKNKATIKPYDETGPVETIKESFSELFNVAKPALNQVISSSTEIIDQINSAVSSSSTSTNVVE